LQQRVQEARVAHVGNANGPAVIHGDTPLGACTAPYIHLVRPCLVSFGVVLTMKRT
jgi:hypothetical protein